MLNNYETVRVLGEGTFGKVSLVKDSAGTLYAAKSMKSASMEDELKHEASIISKLNKLDPDDQYGIVRMKELIASPLTLIMDKYEFSLFAWVRIKGPMTMPQLANLAYQLAHAMKLIHQVGYHTDLKCENVMIQSIAPLRIRICDFGSAMKHYAGKTEHVTTLNYRCPEVICHKEWGPELDMWSIGCILAEMHTGKLLFPGRHSIDILNAWERVLGVMPKYLRLRSRYFTSNGLLRCPVDPSYLKNLSSLKNTIKDIHLVTLIGMLLVYDKNHRYTPDDVMNSTFVKKFK